MSFVLAAEEGFNPLAPELGLPIWVTLAFIVVLWGLAKKVFPKLEEGLADREARIKEELEKAEETRADAERMLTDYKNRIAQAREESNRIVEEARQSAEQVRKDLISRSEGDARLIVDKAQKQLDSERERALGELQSQLATWSTQIAGQIVERELKPEAQRELVEAFIRDVQKKGK